MRFRIPTMIVLISIVPATSSADTCRGSAVSIGLVARMEAGDQEHEDRQVRELVHEFLRTNRNAPLLKLRKLHEQDPEAVQRALPRLAAVVEHSSDEIAVCHVLDLFVRLDSLPFDVRNAVARRFDRLTRKEMFAKAKASSVLLKFGPDRTAARAWLRNHLSDDERQLRLVAAAALGAVGESAGDDLPALKSLLKDKSAAVRVAAACAIWSIAPNEELTEDLVVPTLVDSLRVDDEAFYLEPMMISAVGFTHRQIAAAALGGCKRRTGDVTRALLPLLNERDDDVLRYVVLKSLARLGDRSDDVIVAVRRVASADPNESLRAEAAATLRKLMGSP
ncbi:MAG: HEAT repeat domain-containing protein [Planctomycetales bacterium]